MNVSEQSVATLRPLILYCIEHDMMDTAEFTAERLLAQENIMPGSIAINDLNSTRDSSQNRTQTHSQTQTQTQNINISLNLNNSTLRKDLGRNDGAPFSTPTHSHKLKHFFNDDLAPSKELFEPMGTSNPNLLNNGVKPASKTKLDTIHLYAYVLFKRGRFKSAYNITADYCSSHIGCSYIFAKCCKELHKESDGIRALLRTMPMWEDVTNHQLETATVSGLNPDPIACYMLLAKLYSSLGDIPRASMHYAQVLKINPFIFEAFEALCKLGVKVNVDAIYKHNSNSANANSTNMKDTILEEDLDVDLDDLNDSSKSDLKPIFKTPKTKIKDIATSSPESLYNGQSAQNVAIHINKAPYQSALNSSNGRSNRLFRNSVTAKTPASGSASAAATSSNIKRAPSITSRLLHNHNNGVVHNTSSATTRNNNDGNFNTNFNSANSGAGAINNHTEQYKRDGSLLNGSKRDISSAFGDQNYSNSANVFTNVLKSRGSGLFDNNSNPIHDIKEHDILRNLNNGYLLLNYSKLAKGYQALASYDSFKAIRIFDSLPQNERNTPWVLAKLGKLHFEIVNYEESENYFEKLRKIDRTRLEDMEYYSTLLWHLNKEVELSYLAHELYEVDSTSCNTWICIGNLFSFKKEPEDAIRCFDKAIKFDSKCAYAYTLKGHEYLATDAFENALQSFRQAIVLDSRHYNAFYGIGMIYLKLGDFQKAEFHFRKAVEINPVNVILICCIGMVLEKLGKKEESLKQYELANKIQPLSMLALFKKAQILLGMQLYDDALKDFEKLENLAPDEASVHFLLGKLYKHYGRKTDAIKQFTIALNLDPKGSNLIKEALETLDDGMME